MPRLIFALAAACAGAQDLRSARAAIERLAPEVQGAAAELSDEAEALLAPDHAAAEALAQEDPFLGAEATDRVDDVEDYARTDDALRDLVRDVVDFARLNTHHGGRI